MDRLTKRHAAHCLPYRECGPGTYLYADGCSVRKHGDGTHTLIPYTESDPLPAHTETDFVTHPDSDAGTYPATESYTYR